MRQPEEGPMDPDVVAELDAIDATLRGEAVDPAYAELAELALLVTADRPRPSAAFAAELDARVARRFAAGPSPSPERPSPRRWLRSPAFGGLATALATVAVVVVVLAGGGSSPSSINAPSRGIASAGTSGSSSSQRLDALGAPATTPPATHSSPNVSQKRAAIPASPTAAGVQSASSGAVGKTTLGPVYGPATPAPAPINHGRKQISSAQLQLSTPEGRIEAVAQELFTVVGQVNGIVRSSNITDAAGNNGYANFQLSIPSASLAQTMSQLSSLRYARVVSRTDQTQDVNGQYQADVRRLADARALRTSLLKQLAAATTTTQINSLTAQIHDAEASISSDEATLRGLNHQVDFSNLSVQINAGPIIQPAIRPGGSSGGAFGIGQAAHDAGRVLTVAAGVALIALAALVPVALLAALGLWVAAAVRRRRREQALDAT